MTYGIDEEVRYALNLLGFCRGNVELHLFGAVVLCDRHLVARMESLTMITFCRVCREEVQGLRRTLGRSIRP